MILVAVFALVQSQAHPAAEPTFATSLEGYKRLQAKLARMKSIQIEYIPTSDNAGSHELVARLKRPNMASLNGFSNGWKTDGKWTYENDDNGRIDRPYKKGDLLHLWLPGFESFYDPRNQIQDLGKPKFWREKDRDRAALYIKINGFNWTLFLDRGTGLPYGYSMGIKKAEPEIAYYKLVVNPKFDDAIFRAPK